MNDFVVVTQGAGWIELQLNRPATRNAFAHVADCTAVIEAVDAAEANPDCHALILTGTGSAFSSGGDLKAIADRNGVAAQPRPEATREVYRRGIQRMVHRLWNCELPLITAVNGPAMGLGCDLAALGDLRLAADCARFASSFVTLGLIPGDGGAWILTRAIGSARAAEMVLTGDPIDAAQALDWGLVSRVLPIDELLPAARTLAARLATRPGPALRMAKRLLRESQHQRLADVQELAAAFQAVAHETTEHRDALQRLLQR